MIVGHIGGAGSPYEIQKSLRFRASASAYLSRTPTVAGNRKTWTWSGWVKRGALGSIQALFGSTANGSTNSWTIFRFTSSDTLQLVDGPSNSIILATTAVFRDPSAHFHVVLTYDLNNATSSLRQRIYVNGVQLTLTGTPFSQGSDGNFNLPGVHNICAQQAPPSAPGATFDGYLSEINFIDGQALDPSYFGQVSAETGSWIPKKYTGTYGTNGFYLPFNDGSTLGNLAADRSGNGNNWAANNISLTAGATYDWMDDTPTNNFCTLNPLSSDGSSYHNVYGGNLNWQTNTSVGGSSYNVTGMTFRGAPSSGLWYYEFVVNQINAANTGYIYHLLANCYIWWMYGGTYQIVGSNGTTSIGSISSGDVIQVAVDSTNGKMWYGRNGTWYTVSGTPDPAAGTGASSTFTPTSDPTYFNIQGRTGNVVQDVSFNFGQRPFAYTPPAGFKALCTKNLPTPSILNPKKHFDVVLATGANIKSTVEALYSDQALMVVKDRANANNWQWFNDVTGLSAILQSNTTSAETTYSAPTGSSVGYGWKAGGAPVTNNDGSIQSQVSANPQAGFSIVTYTGTGANATVGHGLGVAPKFIVFKSRDVARNWLVETTASGSFQYAYLNLTNSALSQPHASPTSAVMTLVSGAPEFNQSGEKYVAYCFAEIPGYSKIGSYTGNGSADGPFVYCGFRPKFVMIKYSSGVGNWVVFDTARGTYNAIGPRLYADLSDAEYTGDRYDILSNGFKVRTISTESNASGGTYIFMAFAEAPFQFANAR